MPVTDLHGGKYECASERGFTLIEILIALTLLGISIAILMQLFSTNLRNISLSKNYVPAVVMAEAKMSETMAREKLEEGKVTLKTEDGYDIEIDVAEAFKEKFQTLPVKLLEITLTIRWTIDSKEKEYVLKSYKALSRQTMAEKLPEERDKKKSPKPDQNPKAENQ